MTDATQQTPGDPQSHDRQEPSTEELQEPSTEKDVDEEPRAPRPHDPEPDHQAVGIGVIGGPETDAGSDGSDAGSDCSDSVSGGSDAGPDASDAGSDG